MERIRKEKSIIGRINDMSHKLVLILVFPIIISLVLMLFYAGKYHRSIVRIETISSLKAVVEDEIPEYAWEIVSGRGTFVNTGIYETIKTIFCPNFSNVRIMLPVIMKHKCKTQSKIFRASAKKICNQNKSSEKNSEFCDIFRF